MESATQQLVDVEPKKVLYFGGPFTDTVVSHIRLTNLQEYAVCFKVKTTAPKRYCVRPSCGVLQPKEKLDVAVMLQPFVYDQQERPKHKFMIQTMRMPEGDVSVDQAWKEADPSGIVDWKLVCILRQPGELVLEPAHDLSFEGSSNKSTSLSLTNPSPDRLYFKLQSSFDSLSCTPDCGWLEPNQSIRVIVKSKPLSQSGQDPPRERLVVKSCVYKESDTRTLDELIESGEASTTTLKCSFTGSRNNAEDKIKSKENQSNIVTSDSGQSALLNELNKLRAENKELKAADIERRRIALSEYCRSSAADGGAAIGRHGALGAIASVPPILYLILALLIGLILGKFAL